MEAKAIAGSAVEKKIFTPSHIAPGTLAPGLFLLQRGSRVVPLEVKAEKNVNSSSLRHYIRKFAPPLALRGSMLDYRRQAEGVCELVNFPLYAIDRVCGESARLSIA